MSSVIGSINRCLSLAQNKNSVSHVSSGNGRVYNTQLTTNQEMESQIATVTVDEIETTMGGSRNSDPNSHSVQDAHTLQDGRVSRKPTRKLLEYPRDFFNHKTGAGPANAEEAKRLWMYRKSRRQDGLADTEEPDGEKMLAEIKEIRESLRQFITLKYSEDIRLKAKEMNLKMVGKASFPHSIQDFKNIVVTLENNESNQRLVFELVHLFHKDRGWLSNAIDMWLFREGMCLAEV